MCRDAPSVEDGVRVGSAVLARLKGTNVKYIYGTVECLEPLSITSAFGKTFSLHDLSWVALAKDDGWLAPHGLEWLEPGESIIFKLLKTNEWVSAKIAPAQSHSAFSKRSSKEVFLEGIDGLEKISICDDVALLFTPHVSCKQEFSALKPRRGGKFVEHVAAAFVCENDGHAQRQRWAVESRSDGQYPVRAVWVHPQVKQLAMKQFVKRCSETRDRSPSRPSLEIIIVMGPPGCGKSSVGSLSPGNNEDVCQSVYSLKHRQEVNNDNLTNCMPSFVEEYREAFQFTEQMKRLRIYEEHLDDSFDQELLKRYAEIAKVEDPSWAIHWLVYLMYHHGPVRDSFCWDVITATVVDAAELPVFYTTVMAGRQVPRNMQILELASSCKMPVPHAPLRSVILWTYASTDVRYRRQCKRHEQELQQQSLQGGNADSNLVDLHYQQWQSEVNIIKTMACLQRGKKPNDDDGIDDCIVATSISSWRFLMIGNEIDGEHPQILVDSSNHNDARGIEVTHKQQAMDAAEAIVDMVGNSSLRHPLFSCACHAAWLFSDDTSQALQVRCSDEECSQVYSKQLMYITHISESMFQLAHPEAPATRTESHLKNTLPSRLPHFREDDKATATDLAAALQPHLDTLRKFCCLSTMQKIRDSVLT